MSTDCGSVVVSFVSSCDSLSCSESFAQAALFLVSVQATKDCLGNTLGTSIANFLNIGTGLSEGVFGTGTGLFVVVLGKPGIDILPSGLRTFDTLRGLVVGSLRVCGGAGIGLLLGSLGVPSITTEGIGMSLLLGDLGMGVLGSVKGLCRRVGDLNCGIGGTTITCFLLEGGNFIENDFGFFSSCLSFSISSCCYENQVMYTI